MFLFIIASIIFVSLIALAVVIRDVGQEISGMDEACKSRKEKDDEKLRKALEKWREGK